MDAGRVTGRIDNWARHLYRITPERLAREEPLRAELLRHILRACFAALMVQGALLVYLGIDSFWFIWTTAEPAALLAVAAWCARKRQTHLATVLLLVALSHVAAFLQGRYEHLAFSGVLLVPTILVCGLLIGEYFVLKWTLVCCGLLAWVTAVVHGGREAWWTAAAWSVVYIVTAWLVMLFSRHLERLLEADRTAEEQQRSAIVAERTRFAREIHDTLAQGFTGIMMQLNAADQRLEAEPERAREHLEKARQLARQSLEEARRSVSALRPGPLANGDLLSAIEQLGRQITSASSIELQTRLEGQPYALSEEREAHLLRIAQEALTNAVRHSGPGRIDVRLCYQPRSVVLEVRDDGCGISGSQQPGFGLKNMSERARQIGAEFTILSKAGHGTQIVTTVPT
jgi:signal transduction histidine kinase